MTDDGEEAFSAMESKYTTRLCHDIDQESHTCSDV